MYKWYFLPVCWFNGCFTFTWFNVIIAELSLLSRICPLWSQRQLHRKVRPHRLTWSIFILYVLLLKYLFEITGFTLNGVFLHGWIAFTKVNFVNSLLYFSFSISRLCFHLSSLAYVSQILSLFSLSLPPSSPPFLCLSRPHRCHLHQYGWNIFDSFWSLTNIPLQVKIMHLKCYVKGYVSKLLHVYETERFSRDRYKKEWSKSVQQKLR